MSRTVERHAAIYCRISFDREGEALGVARQEEDCRSLADQLGYTVTEVYVDNDRSASTRTRTVRPEYARMLDGARAGEFGVILAYSNSRLTRRPRELEDLIELYERHGTRIHTVVSGNDDLSTADGRMVARIKAGIDAAEAERLAERVSRAARQAAESGKWHGGRRPFGYDDDGVTVRKDEAEAIQEAYQLVLAGGSVRSVMREWNARGLRTVQGNPWTLNAVRELLCNARYAGRRVYKGQVVAEAEWPALVDPTVFEAVHAQLRDPSRRHGTKSPRRLLSGLALCGVCGATVHCAGSTAERHRYRCSQAQGHVSRSGPYVDHYVEALAVARLSQPDAAELLQETDNEDDHDELRDQLTAARTRLDQLAVEFADGGLTASQLRAATQRLTERITDLEARLAAGPRRNILGPLVSAEDIAALWETLDTDRRRSVINELMRVRIMPARRGSKIFQPESVAIEWKS